jgi:coenzyme F420-0:L-glutamate ligase/coenzyme F420-1:gamma-L-glutamate ligase
VNKKLSKRLELTALNDFPMIKNGDDLATCLITCLKENEIDLIDGDVIVIAQKVISKAEGRQVNLADVEVSENAKRLGRETDKDPRVVELILRESKHILRSRPGLIIAEHKQGFVCANAGIDRSNVSQSAGVGSESVLLLPEDPERSARNLRAALEQSWNHRIGVLVIDSHGRAWRNGTVGISIGFSGIPSIVDMRGEKDLFGYELRVTEIAAADELAAGASLLMGQAKEGRPVVHVRGFPYSLREGEFAELLRDPERDLFR